MTSAEKGIIRPLDQGPAEKDQGNSLGPSLQDPTQKIPGAQPPRTVESGPQLPTLKSQKPPAYQPYQEGDPVLAIEHASLGTKESDVEYVGAATSDFDSDSDTEQLQPAAGETWGENSPAAVERWADSGPGSDIVRQSSDEFEDEDEMDEELGEEDDEGDDGGVYEEDDEDDLSDYTGMEEMEDMSAQGTAEYHRALQHGPYLKSRQQVEQLRKRRPGPLRNRPPRLRTVSGSGAALRLDTGAGSSAYNHPIQANVGFSTQNAFTQSCDELTARLLQEDPSAYSDIKDLIEISVKWRTPGDTPPDVPFTAEKLQSLEYAYLGNWTKILTDRRFNPHTTSIVEYLQAFVQLSCLIVQMEGSLPEQYSQALATMFEYGDLEIYKRNPKRPSRLIHAERMARFDDYSPEYGFEAEEISHSHQDFQKLFISLKGMEIYMKAIEAPLETPDRLDLKAQNLSFLLAPISRIRIIGDTLNVTDFSKRLIAAVLAYFPDHADSFKSVSKGTILDIIGQVGFFLLENYPMQAMHSSVIHESGMHFEEFDAHDPISRYNLGEVKFADFRLEMAVRLMKTTRLDLRLAGLIELKEVLVRIQNLQQGRSRPRRRSDIDMEVQMEHDRKPIEHLCNKLQSLQIVGYIFGPNIHLEIVQRSTDVLVFLNQAKVLRIEDIDLIWAAVGGNQHRSIVYGVYQVLSDVCSKLPQEILRHLFKKLQAVPLESWDLQLVELARSLFLAMVQRAKYNPLEGTISLIPYETLLNVLRKSTLAVDAKDDTSFGPAPTLNREVSLGIAHLLSDGLQVGPLPQDRATLIEQCLQDLRDNHPGAIWSLQVVQGIFIPSINDSVTMQLYKRTCATLPELFIANLSAYAASVKRTPPSPSPTNAAFALHSSHSIAHEHQRSMQLKVRLDFLKCMCGSLPVYWNTPGLAETLWKCLIVDPIGPNEQDEAFLCLEAITEQHFAEYIYEKLLPDLDISSLTPKAWQCTRQYFVVINWNRQLLTTISDDEGPQPFVVVAPLCGMDLIWKIALHAKSPIVGIHATEFLSSLIKSNDDEEALDEVYDFRAGLVQTCVDHLVHSSDVLGTDGHQGDGDMSLVFERCIGILKAFLSSCSSGNIGGTLQPEIHGALDEEAMLTIKTGGHVNFQLSAHPSSTLLSLRRTIASRMGCVDVEAIRLISLGKDYSTAWDQRSLEELRVENGQTFLVTRRPVNSSYTRETPTPRRLPTDLLLEPEFFERVRKIFLLDSKYASQAWEIVTRLPTSPVLLRSFEELQDDVNWDSLLDARSPFLLLYSLQILHFLIKRDQSTWKSEHQAWIQRFLELGGQEHLIGLLMAESGLGSTNSSDTSRKALGLMLKVLVCLSNSADLASKMSTSSQGYTVPVFLNRLVSEILTSAARGGEHTSHDQSIVLNATNLISYFCAGPMGWQYFQAGADVRSLIFVSMVQSDSVQIRQTILDMGRKFCSQRDSLQSQVSPALFFLDILQSFLPISKEYESNCSELFEFFESIAREDTILCSEEYVKTLHAKVVENIASHSSSETAASPMEDTILIGMFRVATAMLGADSRLKQGMDLTFIDYVFDVCLFPLQSEATSLTPTWAKCQSEGSRSSALLFLEEATKGNPFILRHAIERTHKNFVRDPDMDSQWGYDPQIVKRARCGYVGLQNLGATCYVNSIIQQFFMNKEFRFGILDAPAEGDGSVDKHDTLLYQLQALFGHLQTSMRRSYNAHSFCYAYKDWDGNPMNVAVQMDVDEFFNILFDRLESSVKSSPQEELFKKQYGGKLVQQIKSKDCEHISEREDSFFSIQCEVKNKKSLEESLQLYVQGEILDGDNKYKCSTCDKHVDAIKRACIKELPQNLILHLKRFDYDMDTMRRIKINDRFEFPTRLNMEPYTLDYLTKKEQVQEGGSTSPSTNAMPGQDTPVFQYDLVGVLVHTGTADSGHYYSYIKDRSQEKATHFEGEGTSWYHFNDSKVEEFDAGDIPAKAFGGPEFIQSESPYMKSPPRSTTKPYSAYMLFYERAERPALAQSIASSGDVPKDIKDVVAKENITLLKDLAVFDRLYYNFVWELFNAHKSIPTSLMNEEEDGPEEGRLDYLAMEYGLDFFFTVLIHARDVDQELLEWTKSLVPLLARYPAGCAKFLNRVTENQERLCSILLECPINQVRDAVISLISEALSSLLGQDSGFYGYVHTSPTMIMSPDPRLSSPMDIVKVPDQTSNLAVQAVIQRVLDLLPNARPNWRNFDEYFRLMYNMTQMGRTQCKTMIQAGYVTELVEFYLSDEKAETRQKKMGDKFTKPAFRNLMLTVQELVLTCDILRSIEGTQRKTNGHASGPNSNAARLTSPTSTSSGASSPSSNSDDAATEDLASESSELDQTICLSQADLTSLLCYQSSHGPLNERPLQLVVKMLHDRMDSAIISKIVIHLSAHRGLGSRLLDTLTSFLGYSNDDQFGAILQVLKDIIQIEDDALEQRVEHIIKSLLKVLESTSMYSVAFECLEFFRNISDYGQCGRVAQALLLANSNIWLMYIMIQQNESELRHAARQFYMELLNSEKAFNAWDDAKAAEQSAHHFTKLLELLKPINDSFYQGHRRDDDETWKLADYFVILTELIHGDRERHSFRPHWIPFLELLTKIDLHKINLDFDKKEMMVFWGKIMNNDVEMNTRLANHKPLRSLLCGFYVYLQHHTSNIQFHREVLPVYFGLTLLFAQLSPDFHRDWAQSHNYSWALSAMKWGDFGMHCPAELDRMLQYTLSVLPAYRKECWRQINNADTPKFGDHFVRLARAMYEAENELSGALFLKNHGLVHLTNFIVAADKTPSLTTDDNFYATAALSLLYDYLCNMNVCRNTPYFAEAMDHWGNIGQAIDVLLRNLMWAAPYEVYAQSIAILQFIAREATYTQASVILSKLDSSHSDWRNSVEAGDQLQSKLSVMFGGAHSPFCQYGVLDAPQQYSGVSLPPMRIGPLIYMHPDLFASLDMEASRTILKKWFEPYWTLAQLACRLDGEKKQYSHAVELAALMAMEQVPIGVLTHFEILCETAELAEDDADIRHALQTPYVSIFWEKFLSRTVFLMNLSRAYLETGSRLLKLSNVKTSLVQQTIETSFTQIRQILQRHVPAAEAATGATPVSTAAETEAGVTVVIGAESMNLVPIEEAEVVITCLQNLVLVGIESVDPTTKEFCQWQELQKQLDLVVDLFPHKFAGRLVVFLPSDATESEPPAGLLMEEAPQSSASVLALASAPTLASVPDNGTEAATPIVVDDETSEEGSTEDKNSDVVMINKDEGKEGADHPMTEATGPEVAPPRERMEDDDA